MLQRAPRFRACVSQTTALDDATAVLYASFAFFMARSLLGPKKMFKKIRYELIAPALYCFIYSFSARLFFLTKENKYWEYAIQPVNVTFSRTHDDSNTTTITTTP